MNEIVCIEDDLEITTMMVEIDHPLEHIGSSEEKVVGALWTLHFDEA
jgi:hypothetical protein